MSHFLEQIRYIYRLFSENGPVMTGFVIAICYLMYMSKNKLLKKYFIYPTIVVLIVINNPITINLLVDSEFLVRERYVRLYWLIPVSMLIAYTCTMIMERCQEKKRKYAVGFLMVCLIVISGNYMFQSGNFQSASNLYKLPQEAVDVTDRIVQDVEESGAKIQDTRIVVDGSLSGYIRQYNGEIKLLYGRHIEYTADTDWTIAEKVKDAMAADVLDCELVAVNARKGGCSYIVIHSKKSLDGSLEYYGYEFLDTVDGYSVYKDVLEDTQWVVTQYGTRSDIQSMFYTLTSTDGKLIIIDGGHDVDAPVIREIAAKHDNVIDVWICTHFHEAHIGAANVILSNPQDITVKEIWRPYMEQSAYDSFAQAWDTVEASHTFFALTEGMENVRCLQTGDELQVDNLRFKIFSVFDPARPETYEGNNCGFVFKVTGNQDSMLFCADSGIDLSNFLLQTYGEQLKADYIQMGHHGNGGLSEECYRLINPKVAFFDAHEELFFDTTGRYTTPQNREIMESMGCIIYRLATAPNRVLLK